MQILILSDIHANFPALQAIEETCDFSTLDCIINCGDSVVYGAHPNETLSWLASHNCLSILGNTDKKVITLLRGKTFAKPSKPEKRIMYTWTAEQLSRENSFYLQSLKKKDILTLPLASQKTGKGIDIGIYHGSPARNHEFLFSTTPDDYFHKLAAISGHDIVLCGHSHDPFHKLVNNCHFINPGSVGRMFDGDPRPSFALLRIANDTLSVEHLRIDYDIDRTVNALRNASLPEVYCDMFKIGRKTN